ncbi:zinc finger protein 850 isoform X2 [Parambassis ranga]|nr:zinc finger protein 850-like isoform X2 [Parambassis ranga]XP_028284267.1 zinc finger protein 850-like isoform X2 [Parambassis ranga]
MSWVDQRFCDITPVTLQVAGGAVSSTLYCGEVEGLLGVAGGLVESFLVELYRCKLCQYTCGLKAHISSHLLVRHRTPTVNDVRGSEDREEGGEEAGLQQGASPYQMDLNSESKQSDEDEEFLLYNMLDNMSPATCDITEGGLQVAHTCEVSTLFEEEESSIFPLKRASVDLSCPIDPPTTQEEMAQSAHLKTLGLCRISTPKPPPPAPPSLSPLIQQPPPPDGDDPSNLPQSDIQREGGADGQQARSPSSRRQRLPCLLCPLMLPTRHLLDIHISSHQAPSGFRCVCCSWMSESWEELELHWRSHCRRKRRKGRRLEERKKMKTVMKNTSQKALQSYNLHSDEQRGRLSGRAEGKALKHPDSQSSRSQAGSLQGVMETGLKTRLQKHKPSTSQTDLCCSLCHRLFSSKLTLRRHLGVHGGEKPFSCPHCSYSSRLKASLLQHLRTHTGQKPYRCAECPYASIDRSSLLRHCRTHSQEKPYRCQHCDYSSIQKKSLDLHARRHHTGEVFPCQHCEYSSPDHQLLRRHVHRNHAASQQAALASDQRL